jgi:hypothetical protein
MDNLKKFPKLAKNAPEATKAFWAYDKAALADGVLPKKYKELCGSCRCAYHSMRLLHRDSPEVGSRGPCD